MASILGYRLIDGQPCTSFIHRAFGRKTIMQRKGLVASLICRASSAASAASSSLLTLGPICGHGRVTLSNMRSGSRTAVHVDGKQRSINAFFGVKTSARARSEADVSDGIKPTVAAAATAEAGVVSEDGAVAPLRPLKRLKRSATGDDKQATVTAGAVPSALEDLGQATTAQAVKAMATSGSPRRSSAGGTRRKSASPAHAADTDSALADAAASARPPVRPGTSTDATVPAADAATTAASPAGEAAVPGSSAKDAAKAGKTSTSTADAGRPGKAAAAAGSPAAMMVAAAKKAAAPKRQSAAARKKEADVTAAKGLNPNLNPTVEKALELAEAAGPLGAEGVADDASGVPLAAALSEGETQASTGQTAAASPTPKTKGKHVPAMFMGKEARKAEEELGLAGSESEQEGGAGSPTKKAKKKGKGAASKMDGVGTGALSTALLAADVDVNSLISWAEGKPVPYVFLADTFEAISETTKRLAIAHMLTNTFRAILASRPEDLLPTVYMCANRVAPAHAGVELGIGEAALIKSIADATGQSEKAVKASYEKLGDLGAVAVAARSTQKPMFPLPPLTLAHVFKTFKDIAYASGDKSVERKRGLIVKLLAAAKGNEAGYIIRSLQGKLRIGLAEQSLLLSLAHAVHLHNDGVGKKGDGNKLAERLEEAAVLVKTVYSECPSFDVMIPALLAHPLAELPQHCHFMPGVPVKPMLAKATTGVSEVLDKFTGQEFTCEYKYDGERAQVHLLPDGTINIFSRNAENNTGKYPDILARLPALLQPHVKSIVFDSEAVGWDAERKKVLPFQILSTRARKDVALADIKVPVVLFAFDCLFLNGESLLQKSLVERREALYSALKAKEGELMFATTKTSNDIEELQLFLNEAVDASTEGLIVKTLADTYEPSKRSSHWLKLKKDYMAGVGDTFDVVPVGAWYGKGKRTGVFGAYLLAVYNPDDECYQTISKLGTGFSEEMLEQLSQQLRPSIINKPPSYYRWGDTQEPDVWFEPVAVWEVKAADLSISPVHKAALGLVDPSKGISIRFPRLIRVRDDKGPEDATTAEQVADMYRSQAVVKSNAKARDDEDDE